MCASRASPRASSIPKAPEHADIVDLDKAPRNARGMVEYEIDVFILRPADPAKGNGILFYEVLNRGNKQLGSACTISSAATPAR